jgi:hypothetical protein
MVALSALRSQAMAWQRLKVDVTADSCSRPGRQNQVLHLGDLGVDHTDGQSIDNLLVDLLVCFGDRKGHVCVVIG